MTSVRADAWHLRKLFTYGCKKSGFGRDRKSGKSPVRKVLCFTKFCNQFFSGFKLPRAWSSPAQVSPDIFFRGVDLMCQSVLNSAQQVPIVGEFYDVLLKFWRFKQMPAAPAEPSDASELIEVPENEDGDQEEDLSEFLIVKDEDDDELKVSEDPYSAAAVMVPDAPVTAAESTAEARELVAVAEMPDISPAAPESKTPGKDMPVNARKACVFDAEKLDHDKALSDEDLDKKIALLTSFRQDFPSIFFGFWEYHVPKIVRQPKHHIFSILLPCV